MDAREGVSAEDRHVARRHPAPAGPLDRINSLSIARGDERAAGADSKAPYGSDALRPPSGPMRRSMHVLSSESRECRSARPAGLANFLEHITSWPRAAALRAGETRRSDPIHGNLLAGLFRAISGFSQPFAQARATIAHSNDGLDCDRVVVDVVGRDASHGRRAYAGACEFGKLLVECSWREAFPFAR